MNHRIVDLYLPNLYLNVYRGFLQISQPDVDEKTNIPLDDILCIIASGFGITFSKPILARLGELGIPLVICNNSYHPTSILLPTAGYHKATYRLKEQINVSQPLQKRLWQTIIKLKVKAQAETLNNCDIKNLELLNLVEKVKSGDITNVEAVAAKIYWKKLFGQDFIRDFDASGINTYLNFGYGIIRSVLARYIIGCGLSPCLGIHHRNMYNNLCLCDDLIEPFRPLVDEKVYQLCNEDYSEELTPEVKKSLADILRKKMTIDNQKTSLRHCLQATVLSLVKSYEQKENLLISPK